MFKRIVASAMLVSAITVTLLVPAMVFAQEIGLNTVGQLGLQATAQDPRDAAVEVIKYLMTFLGIIAVAIILLGGFRWMTAAGNEDKVSEAKKILSAGVVGLIIILAAFAIVNFVVTTSSSALNGTLN